MSGLAAHHREDRRGPWRPEGHGSDSTATGRGWLGRASTSRGRVTLLWAPSSPRSARAARLFRSTAFSSSGPAPALMRVSLVLLRRSASSFRTSGCTTGSRCGSGRSCTRCRTCSTCLMVCVEAGLGFDAAVARVAEQARSWSGARSTRSSCACTWKSGRARPREEALRSLGERCGVEEAEIDGERVHPVRSARHARSARRCGSTPMSARVQRRHRAEERASPRAAEDDLPHRAFLMPAFFLVTMAPSLLGLMKSLRRLVR